MACETPDLRQNLLSGKERRKKIFGLLTEWYKAAAQTDPPPVTDKSILAYDSKVSYYYTSDVQQKSNILDLVLTRLTAAVAEFTGLVVDFNSIGDLVAQSLADTTRHETSQGYSTCVLRSFEGEFSGKRCLFKPMVVAVSFNFSASEYKTSGSVAAFGYWVYLFCTEPPFFSEKVEGAPSRLRTVHGEPLEFDIPHDMEIVGKKFMTTAELDARGPTSFTRNH
ncbi:hypothetical protein Clacol_000943 [Clathrus columnatus]|uniref:Uncharacterized protein n=1 Tax=Clathrus columnatus TaxID=1419009 RepID=A0AAV5A022_9AGAM|nr:hypothetical protein Clacol_000943 [Clathrus columnatus]